MTAPTAPATVDAVDAVDAERDPITAAAVIVLLGMLAALERGEAVATTCHAVDDPGEWSLHIKLAEVPAAQRETPAQEPTTGPCPLCKQPGFAGECRHCHFVDD